MPFSKRAPIVLTAPIIFVIVLRCLYSGVPTVLSKPASGASSIVDPRTVGASIASSSKRVLFLVAVSVGTSSTLLGITASAPSSLLPLLRVRPRPAAGASSSITSVFNTTFSAVSSTGSSTPSITAFSFPLAFLKVSVVLASTVLPPAADRNKI